MEIKIIGKPWGREELIENNERYMMKRLTMLKNHRCSLQYHEVKKETIYVISGRLKIVIGKNESNLKTIVLNPNEAITIGPGTIHRMEALSEAVYLEASSPELDDVIRIRDDYNRVKK